MAKLVAAWWAALLLAALSPVSSLSSRKPPVVWTIAGSDSGGGAGIQADLPTIRDFGCHGCSVVTALTAQNSVGVTHVQAATPECIAAQVDALASDLPADAIKIGMVGSAEAVHAIADGLERFFASRAPNLPRVPVVLDPVLVATSGARLGDDTALAAVRDRLGPLSSLVTPNLVEAEVLLGLEPGALCLAPRQVVEEAAEEIRRLMRCGAVVIKGGHAEGSAGGAAGLLAASDVLVSRAALPGELARVKDAAAVSSAGTSLSTPAASEQGAFATRAVWLSTPRFASAHTHGTGCTLSSACAASLARGASAGCDDVLDALVLAKAYVTRGIAAAGPLGRGPGPVAHTGFPTRAAPEGAAGGAGGGRDQGGLSPLPVVQVAGGAPAAEPPLEFASCAGAGHFALYPIVDSAAWVERLAIYGARDVQLRIKKAPQGPEWLSAEVARAQAACERTGCRLWVNDHWALAVEHRAYGCHVGQTDLTDGSVPEDGLRALSEAGVRLGVSTATASELAGALALRPSYVALGPIFTTYSKDSEYQPRGAELLRAWRDLMPPQMPLVAIGGVTLENAPDCLREGDVTCGIAVISAVTGAEDVQGTMAAWAELWEKEGSF